MIKSDIDLSSLRVFLEVSEDCNMSAAAKRLDITQPAISSAIHKLEEALHVDLFDRSSRPITLTAAGRILQSRGHEIVSSMENLATEVVQSMHGKMPHLRLGSSDSISACCVPYFIDQLIPITSSLSAYTASTPTICNLLINKKLDIAIATDPLNTRKEICSIPLHSEDFLVVAPAEYEGKIHRLADMIQLIRQFPVIRFNDASLDAIQVERVLRQCNVFSPRIIEADTNQMILSLVSQGKGWTVMPVLNMWLARDFLTHVSMHKLQALQARRRAFVLYENSFYAPLAEKNAQMIRKTIEDVILPKMGQNYPLMARSLSVLQS